MTQGQCKKECSGWLKGAVILPCLALLSAGSQVQAKGPREERPREEDSRTVRGTIQSMTTAPKGEIDGALLEDGTALHWPPRLEDRFGEIIKPGDRVTATGFMRRGREGDERLEVRKLTNVGTNATAENDDRGLRRKRRKGPPPPPRRSQQMETIRGKVERMTTAPKGEIDGAVLDDGAVLHWPPHLEERFANVVIRGDRIEATGFEETTRKGDEHFEVASATNLRTNAAAKNDETGNTPDAREARRDRERGRRNGADNRAERIRDLKKQVERLQREIERLEDER